MDIGKKTYAVSIDFLIFVIFIWLEIIESMKGNEMDVYSLYTINRDKCNKSKQRPGATFYEIIPAIF
jgi:hypothetical protein